MSWYHTVSENFVTIGICKHEILSLPTSLRDLQGIQYPMVGQFAVT